MCVALVCADAAHAAEENLSVLLPVKGERAYYSPAVPPFPAGAQVPSSNKAFPETVLQAKQGRVAVSLGRAPVIVEDVAARASSGEGPSPMGLHPPHTYAKPPSSRRQLPPPSRLGYMYDDAVALNAGWGRPEYYVRWGLVQPTDEDVARNRFDWSSTDYVIQSAPADMELLVNVGGVISRLKDGRRAGPTATGSPGQQLDFEFAKEEYEERFAQFVQATVERYDGDGVADMPGLQNPVTHWQVLNEPDFYGSDAEGYGRLLALASLGIRRACPECRIACGGVSRFLEQRVFDDFYVPALKQLEPGDIDIFDAHLLTQAGVWEKDILKRMEHARNTLDSLGFRNVELWSTEAGTYSGSPLHFSKTRNFPYQSEQVQAADLVKRFVSLFGLGARKVFWSFGIEEGFIGDGTFFDNFGLIYDGKGDEDPGRGVRKLAYYSFARLAQILKGADVARARTLDLGPGVTAVQFLKGGGSVVILWAD